MNRLSASTLIVLLAACAASERASEPADGSRAAGPELDTTAQPPSAAAQEAPAAAPSPHAQQPGAPLDLQRALLLARQSSPALQAIAHEIQGQQELLGVAGRLPDPELSLRAESVPFSSPRSGEELVAGISQPLPLGGRLATRRALAEGSLEALRARERSIAAEVEARLRGAFATALSLQEAEELQGQLLAVARESESLAMARVEAGDLTPDELVRLRAASAGLERELLALRARRAAAGDELSALIGREDASVHLSAQLDEVLELPSLQALIDRIEASPLVAEAQAMARLAELSAELAAAERMPLVNLDLFYRQRSDERDGFDVGVHFELPLSGRRGAEGRAARARTAAASRRAELQRRESLLELGRMHARTARAHEIVRSYEQELVPAAEGALAAAEDRLQAGDLSLVEILPLRSEAARVRLARLDAWHELLAAWAELSAFLPRE